MSALRKAIFFAGLVLAMEMSFTDIRSLLETQSWTGDEVIRRWGLLAVFAVAAGWLATRASVLARLPANPVWYVLVAIGAVLYFLAGRQSLPSWLLFLAKPLLIAAVVLILARLEPTPGTVYELIEMPAVRVYLAFTLLLALSFDYTRDFWESALVRNVMEKLPPGFGDLIVSAVIVAILMLGSGFKRRPMYPSPATGLVTTGIVLCVIAILIEAAAFSVGSTAYGKGPMGALLVQHAPLAGFVARIAAHIALFAGAYYLFIHLLPRDAVRKTR